jgi:hypothetical protein
MGTIKKDLLDTLEDNVGRVVTIFTVNGCCKGFTGLLISADSDTVKLVTELPSRFSSVLGTTSINSGCLRNNLLTTSVVIPTNRIVAVCFSDL